MDAKKELIGFIFIFIIIGIVWFFTGGPERITKESPFVVPPGPVQEARFGILKGEGVGLRDGKERVDEAEATIPTADFIEELSLAVSSSAVKKADPNEEYVEINFPKTALGKALLTGLRLEGVRGLDIAIGKGVYLIMPATLNTEQAIFLEPGDKAIITTGQSPVGYSFRLNKCTGYFEQFQDFTPRLPKECPYPRDEDLPQGLEDACLDYIDRLPRCEIHDDPIPDYLSVPCRRYISREINYKTCVDIHKNDSDFYKNEWRVYLGRDEDLWKTKRETIRLLGKDDVVIDSVSY
jgi:hypothetical protein